MAEFIFQRYVKDTDRGCFVMESSKSLDVDFGGLRYMSFSGLNGLGARKDVYVENYPESDAARVWLGSVCSREQTTLTLTVASFGCDPSLPRTSGLSDADVMLKAEKDYCGFIDYVSSDGCRIVYHDDVRNLWVAMYLKEATSTKKESVHGVPYLTAEIKFTNFFGRTFTADVEITEWLKSGGGYYDLNKR
jgi:hypothetical protein